MPWVYSISVEVLWFFTMSGSRDVPTRGAVKVSAIPVPTSLSETHTNRLCTALGTDQVIELACLEVNLGHIQKRFGIQTNLLEAEKSFDKAFLGCDSIRSGLGKKRSAAASDLIPTELLTQHFETFVIF